MWTGRRGTSRNRPNTSSLHRQWRTPCEGPRRGPTLTDREFFPLNPRTSRVLTWVFAVRESNASRRHFTTPSLVTTQASSPEEEPDHACQHDLENTGRRKGPAVPAFETAGYNCTCRSVANARRGDALLETRYYGRVFDRKLWAVSLPSKYPTLAVAPERVLVAHHVAGACRRQPARSRPYGVGCWMASRWASQTRGMSSPMRLAGQRLASRSKRSQKYA
jgi:hypothetical protein